MPFHERQFRNALGLFATGIVVVATELDGKRLGATVSSFNSVSLSPPLILFSLARTARGFKQWEIARYFAVSVLSENQSDVSTKFARSGDDKWKNIKSLTRETGMPIIADSLASFDCETYARYDGGDHEIIVGHVLSFQVSEAPIQPLVFYKGQYCSLDRKVSIETPEAADTWLHGWG